MSNREIIISRIFNAPRVSVWNAWTKPELIKKWWGPQYFTSPFCQTDFHVGGKYLFCMQSPDGKKYWSTGIYKEIIPEKRIVCTDSFADEKGNVVPASYYEMPGNWFLELEVTVTFEETKDGKTKFTLHHVSFPDAKQSELAKEGWNGSLDKLAESLK